MDQLSNFTSTSFGYVMAFLLPGLAGIYATSYYSKAVRITLEKFNGTEAGVGLFLVIAMASLTVGLLLTAVRSAVYEKGICRRHALKPEDFEKLGADSSHLQAFRAVADEHYRYHQFWGSMTIVLPALLVGMANRNLSHFSCSKSFFLVCSALVLEGVTIWAAAESYKLYVRRAKAILEKKG